MRRQAGPGLSPVAAGPGLHGMSVPPGLVLPPPGMAGGPAPGISMRQVHHRTET